MMPSCLRSIAIVTACLSAHNINAFVSRTTRQPSVSLQKNRLHESTNGNDDSSPSNAEDLFASEGWKPIQKDLDKLPVFACANEQGKPLAYTVETNDNEKFTVPFFYCDVDDAKEELVKAKKNTKLDNLDLIPFPLGRAFQMWAQDQAVIVPNKKAIVQAGAPPNANPIGQQVPLFACMEISRKSENGSDVLPLFMALEEANAAVAQAVEMDGGNANDFEVVSLSLNRAVELLATTTSDETPSFQFIAPEKSFEYIDRFLNDEAFQ